MVQTSSWRGSMANPEWTGRDRMEPWISKIPTWMLYWWKHGEIFRSPHPLLLSMPSIKQIVYHSPRLMNTPSPKPVVYHPKLPKGKERSKLRLYLGPVLLHKMLWSSGQLTQCLSWDRREISEHQGTSFWGYQRMTLSGTRPLFPFNKLSKLRWELGPG